MDDLKLGDRIEVCFVDTVDDVIQPARWDEGELIGLFWTSVHVQLAGQPELALNADGRGVTWRKTGQRVPELGLSANFTWYECLYSDTARASTSITNLPTADETALIKSLSAPFMENVRSLLGNVPVIVTSWFRCEALNDAVGGSSTSEHRLGRAVDFVAPEFGAPYDICMMLADDPVLPFNQLIYENVEGSQWVHISCAEPGSAPKREVLTIDERGTHAGLIAL